MSGYHAGDFLRAPKTGETPTLTRDFDADIDLPDDADAKRATLAELVAYRLQVIAEVTTMLRHTPRYDRDYPALLRAARRIEEWASP